MEAKLFSTLIKFTVRADALVQAGKLQTESSKKFEAKSTEDWIQEIFTN